MKNLKRILFAIVAVVLVSCTIVSVAAATANFSDTAGHWAWDAGQIPYLVEKDVLNGYEDGTFKPDREVKRSEFIKMLDETFGLVETKAVSFSDVKTGDWYTVYFEKANAQGYILGYGSKADPEGYISREEATALLVRYLKLDADEKASASTFTDYNQINSGYRDYVLQAIKANLINGYEQSNGTYQFKPKKTLSRAEALTILYRAAGCIYNRDSYNRDSGAPATNSVITKPVTITGQTLSGRIIISEGVDTNVVAFSNCTITGEVEVRGDARVMFDRCTVNSVVVSGKGGISAMSGTTIDSVEVNTTCDVQVAEGAKIKDLNVGAFATAATISGTGTIDDLEVRCSGLTSTIMPGKYTIYNNLTATLDGRSCKGSSEDESSLYDVDPYVTSDSSFYYVELTATKNGAVYIYYTNTATTPTVSEFDTAYRSAQIKNYGAVVAYEPAVIVGGSKAQVESYRYVVVRFQSGTTKYEPIVLNNSVVASDGFSTDPYLSNNGTTITYKTSANGTVYWYYRENGEELTQNQFLNEYNKCETALKSSVAVTSTTTGSITLNSTYAARYDYVALMVRASNGTYYKPVVLPLTDDGFATIQVNTASGLVSYRTDVSGTVYYYYSTTNTVPSAANFDALWQRALYGSSVSATAGRNATFSYNTTIAATNPYLVVALKTSGTAGKFMRPVVLDLNSTAAGGFAEGPVVTNAYQISFRTANIGTVQYYFTNSSVVPTSAQFDTYYAQTSLGLGWKGQINCAYANYRGTISIPTTITDSAYCVIRLTEGSGTTAFSYTPVVISVKYNAGAVSGTGFSTLPSSTPNTDGSALVGFTLANKTSSTKVLYYYAKAISNVSAATFQTNYAAAVYSGEASLTPSNDFGFVQAPANIRVDYGVMVLCRVDGTSYSTPVSIFLNGDANPLQPTNPTNPSTATGLSYETVRAESGRFLAITPAQSGTLYYIETDDSAVANGTFNTVGAQSVAVTTGKSSVITVSKEYIVFALVPTAGNGFPLQKTVLSSNAWKAQLQGNKWSPTVSNPATGFASFNDDSIAHKITYTCDTSVISVNPAGINVTLVADGYVVDINGTASSKTEGNISSFGLEGAAESEIDYSAAYNAANGDAFSDYTSVYLYVQIKAGMTPYQPQAIKLK